MIGLIVLHRGTVFASHPLSDDAPVTFQYHPDTFAEFLPRVADSMIVGTHIAVKIKDVADYYADKPKPFFQMSAAPVRHPDSGRDWATFMPREYLDQFRPDWQEPVDMLAHGIYIRYIGFRKSARSHAAYAPKHYPVDPYLFTRDNSSERYRRMTFEQMREWAESMQTFVNENDLEPAPSYFKLSAQLLRRHFNTGHSHTLNDKCRGALPGNYYAYFAKPDTMYGTVWEFDQSNAHHHSAEDTPFPLKSAVRQLENVPVTPEVEDKYFSDFHGIYRVLARGPSRPDSLNLPPFDTPGEHVTWVFSNEIPDLLASKVKLLHIFEAWVSDRVDPLPPAFAEWSIDQISGASPQVRRWLKPTLLATYGMLGARPFRSLNIWLHSETGHPDNWHIGRDKWQTLKRKENGTPIPSQYTNVIHRGLIESETRLRTLKMARELRENGLEILAVYADGVYTKTRPGTQPPILGPPWRINEIHNAMFPHRGQVVCDEYEKLPGVAGGLRKTYSAHVRSLEAERV